MAWMVQRRVPRVRDLAPLLRFKPPVFSGLRRRLEGAQTIADLRTVAQRRTPRAAFDYTEGAAEQELSLARARQAIEDVEFHPSILRNERGRAACRAALGVRGRRRAPRRMTGPARRREP